MSNLNDEDMQTNEQIMPFVLSVALLTLFLFAYFATTWWIAFYCRAAIDVCVQARKNITIMLLKP